MIADGLHSGNSSRVVARSLICETEAPQRFRESLTGQAQILRRRRSPAGMSSQRARNQPALEHSARGI
jgi:hypothetical protein